MTKRKIAKVPAEVWENKKKFAHLFGYSSALKGFQISEKLIMGEFELRKKPTKRKKKQVWEIEFEWDR